ncbi:MAG: addiction module antidote protein [Burkholderiaceae bacterium]
MLKKATKPGLVKPPGATADDYTTQLIEDLKNPIEAAAYLEAAIQEGDREALLVAMRHVAAAHGGMGAIARQTGLSRESLYRAFSKRGNPTVATLSSVLAATGLRLSVQPAN